VRREKPRLCSTASLERLARERERAHPSEHGERHRPDLEHDEQDRHPQVLHAQVDEVEQRVEAAHHASRRETGLGMHRVLDLGELRRHARRLLERNSVQGEEGVPRELRREAERAGGIEVRRPVDEGRHAAGPRDRERDFERAFGLGSRGSPPVVNPSDPSAAG
jgi:hypothetical protein